MAYQWHDPHLKMAHDESELRAVYWKRIVGLSNGLRLLLHLEAVSGETKEFLQYLFDKYGTMEEE